jgi:hypothetical protein
MLCQAKLQADPAYFLENGEGTDLPAHDVTDHPVEYLAAFPEGTGGEGDPGKPVRFEVSAEKEGFGRSRGKGPGGVLRNGAPFAADPSVGGTEGGAGNLFDGCAADDAAFQGGLVTGVPEETEFEESQEGLRGVVLLEEVEKILDEGENGKVFLPSGEAIDESIM